MKNDHFTLSIAFFFDHSTDSSYNKRSNNTKYICNKNIVIDKNPYYYKFKWRKYSNKETYSLVDGGVEFFPVPLLPY